MNQTVLVVSEEEKKSYLFNFIRNMQPEDKVLIFVGRKLMWVTNIRLINMFQLEPTLWQRLPPIPTVSCLCVLSGLMTCPVTCVCMVWLCKVSMVTMSSLTVNKPSRTLKGVCSQKQNLFQTINLPSLTQATLSSWCFSRCSQIKANEQPEESDWPESNIFLQVGFVSWSPQTWHLEG